MRFGSRSLPAHLMAGGLALSWAAVVSRTAYVTTSVQFGVHTTVIPSCRCRQGSDAAYFMRVDMAQQADSPRRQDAKERIPVLTADMGLRLDGLPRLGTRGGGQDAARIVSERPADMSVQCTHGALPITRSISAEKSLSNASSVVNR
jgi:hypothetical protein